MSEKRITRRQIVLGSAIAGVAGAAGIVHVLRAVYDVEIPDGESARTVGGKIVGDYDGKEITLEVPRMELNTPEDEEKFKAKILENLEKNPQFTEANEKKFEQWKEKNKQSALAHLEETEKQYLKEIAGMDIDEKQKQALINQMKEDMKAGRDKVLGVISKAKMPPVEF